MSRKKPKYIVGTHEDTGSYVVRSLETQTIMVTIGDGEESAADSSARNLASFLCQMMNTHGY